VKKRLSFPQIKLFAYEENIAEQHNNVNAGFHEEISSVTSFCEVDV
jgi:hypothetical protein